jgi:tRNA dimethylallyltransferase
VRHVALVGVTASGKSAVAMELARRDPTWELVSVDSMQVYRGMDIGTAKPTAQERAEVPHHLLDLLEPHEEATVAWFQAEARAAIAGIERRGHRALLVGGTGLYHRAVVDDLDIPGRHPEVLAALAADPDTEALHRRLRDLDPVAAARMEPTNRRRILRALEVTVGSGRAFSSYGPGLGTYPPTRFQLIGLARPPEQVRARIADRYAQQMATGFLAEVAALRRLSRPLSRTASQALGYRELLAHLDGRLGLEEAVELAVARTRRFARRQRVWFRKDPRIAWIEAGDDHPVARLADGIEAEIARCSGLVGGGVDVPPPGLAPREGPVGDQAP